jgi:hypothetical protein
MIHLLYRCLWVLVTCQDTTVLWLLGYFTQKMQCKVSTESACAWTNALWHSHTQLQAWQCVKLHIIIIIITTGHCKWHFNRLFHASGSYACSWQPVIMKAQVQFQAITCGICGGESGTDTGFCPSTSVFPVNIIPSMLHTHSYTQMSCNVCSWQHH